MKLLGFQCNMVYCVLCVVLGMFIGVNWFCSCITKEGMETAGAAVDYVMNKGVPGLKNFGNKPLNNLSDTFEKVNVPLPEGQLFFYANNKFDPKCCVRSTVSGSGGCACETKEQVDYLRSRGGNKK